MLWTAPLHENYGLPEEAKDGIMVLKRKKINFAELRLCVWQLYGHLLCFFHSLAKGELTNHEMSPEDQTALGSKSESKAFFS